MRYLILLVMGLMARPALAADCIAVDASEIEKKRTEYGMTTAEWRASVTNNCDEAYDATITLHFLDQEGEVLHETLEIVILENNASEDTAIDVTLPAERYKRIAKTRIQIRERKRPI